MLKEHLLHNAKHTVPCSIVTEKELIVRAYVRLSGFYNQAAMISYHESKTEPDYCRYINPNEDCTVFQDPGETTGSCKRIVPSLKIPASVLPRNLARPCTANQPISESFS